MLATSKVGLLRILLTLKLVNHDCDSGYQILLAQIFTILLRYIKHSRQCLTTFPNTLKFVNNIPLRVVFFRCLEMWLNTVFCVSYITSNLILLNNKANFRHLWQIIHALDCTSSCHLDSSRRSIRLGTGKKIGEKGAREGVHFLHQAPQSFFLLCRMKRLEK